jgi:hypothetical protein
MAENVSSIDEVIRALPRVREAVRQEIRVRIEAGETIAGSTSRCA